MALWAWTPPNFDTPLDLRPRLLEQLLVEFMPHRLGRPYDVPSISFMEERNVLVADPASIQHPDSIGPAVTLLHRLDNLLQGGAVMPVAFEDVVSDREPLSRDDQTDANLFAIGAVITRVSPAGLRIPQALAFKVRGGYVV